MILWDDHSLNMIASGRGIWCLRLVCWRENNNIWCLVCSWASIWFVESFWGCKQKSQLHLQRKIKDVNKKLIDIVMKVGSLYHVTCTKSKDTVYSVTWKTDCLFKEDLPYTSKHSRGKTFVVGQQNGHSRENIRG